MHASSSVQIVRTAVVMAALLAAVLPAHARRPSRAECRRECRNLIDFCEAQGSKPAFCRRSIVRHCRRQGLAWCAFETSTTVTTSSTTTTTIDPGPTRNGCNRAEADDHLGEPLVIVRFTAFDYAPECIRVSAGAAVRFSGNFRSFPLIGGDVFTADPSSPFSPPTAEGFDAEFVLETPGFYPYCTETLWSAVFRMFGAVIVE